jgi:lysophospholipase L1-like esterase
MRIAKRAWIHGMCAAGLLAALGVVGVAWAAEPEAKENRWERNIRAFEEKDEKEPPPKEAVLFAGSSSIVGWNLPKYFPDMKTVNRGFGGSQIADSTHFADRIILPHKPKVIALYAGDNDIAGGKTPEQVAKDFQAFVKVVQDALPETRILFIAIKPSIARWSLVEAMRDANARIKAITEKDKRLAYIDIDTPMIGEDGKPRPELFKKDGLHLSHDGYVLWTGLVKPHLDPKKKE